MPSRSPPADAPDAAALAEFAERREGFVGQLEAALGGEAEQAVKEEVGEGGGGWPGRQAASFWPWLGGHATL